MKPFIYFIGLFLVLTSSYGLYEGKVGRIDASAALKLSYDSLVFGMPSNEFDAVKKSNSSLINPDRLESEDDFILTFSPAVHFTNKLGLCVNTDSLHV